ncbi:hypothetical protein SAMN05660748_1541 [Blastococcus aggregatus]|uniref:Uncharacterized protein n=1 Tax=Blastococcus aggregatus TaxID=38502 RepID=A0A285V441_9ACTN|nr:hypothetical protein SAMN05660748_1541 [Blastococcus aggregatus]
MHARLPAGIVLQTYSPLVTGNPEVILFAGDPQPVEIHHRGLWFAGSLLGWTHVEGRVLARVRCVVDGLRHSTWKDLDELRLPDPAHPPRRESFPAAASPSGADDRDDDATRPHALLAGQHARPQKPRYARTPPPARATGIGLAAVPRPALSSNPNRRRHSDELSPV